MKGLMELSSSLLYIIRNADILENLVISFSFLALENLRAIWQGGSLLWS